MDWKRIELLREQFQEIKGEPNELIVRELLGYIEALRPRLEVLHPPEKPLLQQTYLDFSKIPKDLKQGSSDDVRTARIYTELETMIIRTTHTSRLTDTQRDKLDKDVIIINATMEDSSTTKIPSPNDLYSQNPLYRKFADNKIKAMSAHMASNGKIIDALSAYEHPQGWLVYERNNRVLPNNQNSEGVSPMGSPSRPSETSIAATGGFQPGIKRVDSDD